MCRVRAASALHLDDHALRLVARGVSPVNRQRSTSPIWPVPAPASSTDMPAISRTSAPPAFKALRIHIRVIPPLVTSESQLPRAWDGTSLRRFYMAKKLFLGGRVSTVGNVESGRRSVAGNYRAGRHLRKLALSVPLARVSRHFLPGFRPLAIRRHSVEHRGLGKGRLRPPRLPRLSCRLNRGGIAFGIPDANPSARNRAASPLPKQSRESGFSTIQVSALSRIRVRWSRALHQLVDGHTLLIEFATLH
jgi:hypothetical protein